MSGYALGQPASVGPSFQSIIPGSPPAAGANFTLALDSRWVWRVTGCVFTLTTSAVAANRYVTLEYAENDGVSNTVNAAGVVVLAGSTQRFAGSMFRGVAEWNTGSDVLFPLFPKYLYGGSTVSILVASIQAADTLTAIRFVVDRFPTDPEQYPGLEQ